MFDQRYARLVLVRLQGRLEKDTRMSGPRLGLITHVVSMETFFLKYGVGSLRGNKDGTEGQGGGLVGEKPSSPASRLLGTVSDKAQGSFLKCWACSECAVQSRCGMRGGHSKDNAVDIVR